MSRNGKSDQPPYFEKRGIISNDPVVILFQRTLKITRTAAWILTNVLLDGYKQKFTGEKETQCWWVIDEPESHHIKEGLFLLAERGYVSLLRDATSKPLQIQIRKIKHKKILRDFANGAHTPTTRKGVEK